MKYLKTVKAKFIERPNRFVARVQIEGQTAVETVHVKNTGRCRELLIPGVEVVLEDCEGSVKRKTRYDLIAVKKAGIGWINMDSQAVNKVTAEWLAKQEYDYVKPEYTYGRSRVDFYMEKGDDRYLMEVKGCTLEVDGIGYFPDAPTARGVKHLEELTEAVSNGFKCIIAFVIQMPGITEVRPNTATDPAFARALIKAQAAGVEVRFLTCDVGEDELVINAP